MQWTVIKESTWPQFWFQAENVKKINRATFINLETLHDFADKQLTRTFHSVYYSIPLSLDIFLFHWWTQWVATNTWIGSRSSSMFLSLSEQESESLSSKSVLSSMSDPLSATWAGAFYFEELAVTPSEIIISFFLEWDSKKKHIIIILIVILSPKLLIRFS